MPLKLVQAASCLKISDNGQYGRFGPRTQRDGKIYEPHR